MTRPTTLLFLVLLAGSTAAPHEGSELAGGSLCVGGWEAPAEAALTPADAVQPSMALRARLGASVRTRTMPPAPGGASRSEGLRDAVAHPRALLRLAREPNLASTATGLMGLAASPANAPPRS